MGRYEVATITPADEPEVLRLLKASLAGGPTGERTQAFLSWKHRQNPFGSSPGLLARDENGALAAVRLLLRWQLVVDGQVLNAVRAVDTATAPEHQGQGLFTRLTLAALETVAADADLVFNTPNASSRPGYLKMGWSVVGDVPISLRLVRPLRFLKHVRATGQSAVSGRQPAIVSPLVRAADLLSARGQEVAALLAEAEAAHAPGRLSTPKDMVFLTWRYARVPGLDYRAIVVDDSSGLRGLGLGRLRRRGMLTELTLGEVITRPGDTPAMRAVLRGAAGAGTDHVAAHLCSSTALVPAGRTAGYLPVPGRGLSLVVNPRRAMPVAVDRPQAWALSLGDLEVF